MVANPFDDVRMQVMWNRLISVVEEQALTLVRTSFSTSTREAGDLSAGIFDRNGLMLAQAVTGTPGHVNAMAEAVGHFIDAIGVENMYEDDCYITNDPWKGTGHLHDMTVVTPTFHKGELIGYFAATAHMVDVGGRGFGPDANEVYEEGIFIPIMKLIERGETNRDLINIVRHNVREADQVVGDFFSLANCNVTGQNRLFDMLKEFDLENIDRLAEFILEHSRRATLERIAALPAGTFKSAITCDGYNDTITLAATMTIENERVLFDFEGTSPVSRKGVNVPLVYTKAYTCYGLKCAIAPDIPNNAASLAPFEVTAPEGCILNALYPAPVAVRHVVGQFLPDVVFGALTQIMPDSVPAEGASALWNIHMSVRGAFDGTLDSTRKAALGNVDVQQRRYRRAPRTRRAQRHGVPQRCAHHVDRGLRACRPGDFLAQGTIARFGRRRKVPRRSRSDHRGGPRRRLRVPLQRHVRPHEPSGPGAARRPGRTRRFGAPGRWHEAARAKAASSCRPTDA